MDVLRSGHRPCVHWAHSVMQSCTCRPRALHHRGSLGLGCWAGGVCTNTSEVHPFLIWCSLVWGRRGRRTPGPQLLVWPLGSLERVLRHERVLDASLATGVWRCQVHPVQVVSDHTEFDVADHAPSTVVGVWLLGQRRCYCITCSSICCAPLVRVAKRMWCGLDDRCC